MYVRRVMAVALLVCATAARAAAQDEHAGHAGHQPQEKTDAHEAHETGATSRDGSGTSWLPDASPMYAFHATRGAWQLMAHENLFVQYRLDLRWDDPGNAAAALTQVKVLQCPSATPDRVGGGLPTSPGKGGCTDYAPTLEVSAWLAGSGLVTVSGSR